VANCSACAGQTSTSTPKPSKCLQRVAGTLRLVPPKTDDSARTIPLPPNCVKALRDHAERQAAERAGAGMDWEEHGLVFPSSLGTPMEPDNLRRSWGRISTSAGITGVRFHDARHTCVSLLLDLKVPPHIVREIVGHSDIEVTMAIYAHASLDEKRAHSGSWGKPSAEVVAVTVAVKNAPSGNPAGRFGCSCGVVRGGVEPPTFRFSGGRSYQLSYLTVPGAGRARRRGLRGGPDGI